MESGRGDFRSLPQKTRFFPQMIGSVDPEVKPAELRISGQLKYFCEIRWTIFIPGKRKEYLFNFGFLISPYEKNYSDTPVGFH
jgi:hypothetical protein